MPIVTLVLLLCLVAALARNRQLRRRILALESESARALDDDGLMAQVETAASLGSGLAAHLLRSGSAMSIESMESGEDSNGNQDQASPEESPPSRRKCLRQDSHVSWRLAAEYCQVGLCIECCDARCKCLAAKVAQVIQWRVTPTATQNARQ